MAARLDFQALTAMADDLSGQDLDKLRTIIELRLRLLANNQERVAYIFTFSRLVVAQIFDLMCVTIEETLKDPPAVATSQTLKDFIKLLEACAKERLESL